MHSPCGFSDALRTEIATLTGESLPEVTDVASPCLRCSLVLVCFRQVGLSPGVAALARARGLYLEAGIVTYLYVSFSSDRTG